MANKEVEGAKEKKEYRFQKLPENIRQMGEQPEKNRIYIEDYVVTYMHQIFQKKPEEAIVVFVGKKGEGKARDCSFIYGAIDVAIDVLEGSKGFSKEIWEDIYGEIYENFPGTQVLGWGCGFGMWNSQLDKSIRQIQQAHFSQEEKMLFLEDCGEKEEKIYHWHKGKLEEMPGYVIYYDKNPLMQEYVLKGKPKQSFEAEYKDDVMTSVRDVIQKKEEKEENGRFALYGAGAAMLLLAFVGANLLVQSNKKIASLEKTLETLSEATVEQSVQPATGSAQSLSQETLLPTEQKETPSPTAAAKKETSSKSASSGKKKKKNTSTPKPTEKESTGSSQEASALWGNSQSYVVQEGDTLSQIVWRQYHSLAYIDLVKQANNITDENEIKEGERLILPEYTK